MIIDGQRRQPQPRAGGDLPVPGVTVGLDREGAGSAGTQGLAEQFQPLGESGAHHDAVRRRHDAAGARDVVGDRHAQDLQSARIAVAEIAGRRRRQRPSRGGEPGRAGEQRQIGRAGPQVVAGTTASRPAAGRSCRRGARALGDPRARAVPRRQPALGDKLAVGLGDGVARDAQIQCERPRRGQRRSGASLPLRTASRSAPSSAARRPGAGQLEVEVETGRSGHVPCMELDLRPAPLGP